MQFSPRFFFLPFRPIYLSQHAILKIPQVMFLPKVTDQVWNPFNTTGKIKV